jgi:hypothetical protein
MKAKAAERRKEKAVAAAESRRKEAEEAADKAAEEDESRRKEAEECAAADLAKKCARAQEFLEKLTVPEAEGGAGFDSLMEWIESLTHVVEGRRSNGSQFHEVLEEQRRGNIRSHNRPSTSHWPGVLGYQVRETPVFAAGRRESDPAADTVPSMYRSRMVHSVQKSVG